jgi:hypothetical protein
VLQELFTRSHRLQFAVWADHEEITVHNMWFSDEAHFHLDGLLNKQSVRFWVPRNKHMLTKKMHPSIRVTVGIAISSNGLIGLVFSKQTEQRALSEHGAKVLCQLIATGLSLNIQWFFQDGVTPYTEHIVLDFLNVTFLIQK